MESGSRRFGIRSAFDFYFKRKNGSIHYAHTLTEVLDSISSLIMILSPILLGSSSSRSLIGSAVSAMFTIVPSVQSDGLFLRLKSLDHRRHHHHHQPRHHDDHKCGDEDHNVDDDDDDGDSAARTNRFEITASELVVVIRMTVLRIMCMIYVFLDSVTTWFSIWFVFPGLYDFLQYMYWACKQTQRLYTVQKARLFSVVFLLLSLFSIILPFSAIFIVPQTTSPVVASALAAVCKMNASSMNRLFFCDRKLLIFRMFAVYIPLSLLLLFAMSLSNEQSQIIHNNNGGRDINDVALPILVTILSFSINRIDWYFNLKRIGDSMEDSDASHSSGILTREFVMEPWIRMLFSVCRPSRPACISALSTPLLPSSAALSDVRHEHEEQKQHHHKGGEGGGRQTEDGGENRNI
eukprot:ANDGO_07689.mRNA.1 hypothetical protein